RRPRPRFHGHPVNPTSERAGRCRSALSTKACCGLLIASRTPEGSRTTDSIYRRSGRFSFTAREKCRFAEICQDGGRGFDCREEPLGIAIVTGACLPFAPQPHAARL